MYLISSELLSEAANRSFDLRAVYTNLVGSWTTLGSYCGFDIRSIYQRASFHFSLFFDSILYLYVIQCFQFR